METVCAPTSIHEQKHLFGFSSSRTDDDDDEKAYKSHKGHPGEDDIVHIEEVGTESVDLEKNEFLWLPPDPQDEREDGLLFEFAPSPSDHQSTLVCLSSLCVWKGTFCERPYLLRINRNFEEPFGHYLRDHLFDQNYRCRSCEMPAEAHVQYYTHQQGTLSISVKKLPETLLRGQRDGKIWMWHRCLKCPRANGFPPVNRRVVMSEAVWGLLSFGKFLELSFSDHAAVSRVASCGHSLHRDCLQFYGCGEMVACFRYASFNFHSVYLSPPKLGFKYESQEWVEKELTELKVRAEIFFSEVLNALPLLLEMQYGLCLLKSGNPESRRRIADLVGMLHKEKSDLRDSNVQASSLINDFVVILKSSLRMVLGGNLSRKMPFFDIKLQRVESLQKILNTELRTCQPAIDILELNRLRRQLLLQSYAWDDRLIHADSYETKYRPDPLEFTLSEPVQEPLGATDKLFDTNVPVKTGKSLGTSDLTSADTKPDQNSDHGVSETCNNLHEMVRESTDVSDSLDAAWSGENYTGTAITKNCSFSASEADKLSSIRVSKEDMCMPKVSQLPPVLSAKGADNMEDTVSCLGMSLINFYQSLTKKFVRSDQEVERLGEHDPVCISSFRDIEQQHGARFLLPVGVNDIVVPIYDDEPTSIISYALASPEYLLQVSNKPDTEKDAAVPTQSHDAGNLKCSHVLGEKMLGPYQSLASGDKRMLSLSYSHSSLPLNPLLDTKALHAKVSFEDDGLLGKVKYNVTCYYAKQFESLRKIWCPSEVDFIRSLSRCKKWDAGVGKSNVFFSQTLDERFIIKQVTKAELGSFTKFAPEYFEYLSQSISSAAPTCLAKILGIYQVSTKHLEGGMENKMDVLVMENLMYGRNLSQLYDLKGSSSSRHNPDSCASNKVLLDQNLLEAMPTSPIFVGKKAKRLLERAVCNDTAFLASIGVTDYSILVGVDEEKCELVVGIIDFMKEYTWGKHLESWVKTLGIFGGFKSASPAIVSPNQYKIRFRKAINAYLLMVPDRWSPPIIVPNKSETDLFEENSRNAQSMTLAE